MGVYNPFAEMPKSCCECVVPGECEYCLTWDDAESRAPDCPLVEVKGPHGRLADVGESASFDARYDHFDDEHMVAAQAMLDDLPTIIEAEGKE